MKITIKEAVGWIDAEIAGCRMYTEQFGPVEPGETVGGFIRGLEQAKRLIAGIAEATPKATKRG